MRPLPNTPSFGGYLLALMLGSVAFGLFCEVTRVAPGIWSPVLAVGTVVVLSLFSLGLPVLVLAGLATVVHLSLRGIADQRIHVAVAFAVPYVGLLPVALWSHLEREASLMLIGLPVSMALGRAAVVPLVNRRRRRVVSAA